MRLVLVLIFTVAKICQSSILFQITSTNESIQIESSYLLGTVHVSNDLIWPYLSSDTRRILNESNQVWAEHDLLDSKVSAVLYQCVLEKMSSKQRARLRAQTWRRFLHETKEKAGNESAGLNRWKKWFVHSELLSNKYLWRNRTIDKSVLFDHRILLEAYRRNAHVGSLEAIPDDCFQIGERKPPGQSSALIAEILSRTYNCEKLDADFIQDMVRDLDSERMKKRNEQIAEKIRQLLTADPRGKYLFVVGAAHLFGDLSIVQLLQNQSPAHYAIKQIDSPSPNFPSQKCTDEEFQKLLLQIIPVQNVTRAKKFLALELLNISSHSQ